VLGPGLGQALGGGLLLRDERQPADLERDLAGGLAPAPLVGEMALARMQVAQ
jgi:hypothetical protein